MVRYTFRCVRCWLKLTVHAIRHADSRAEYMSAVLAANARGWQITVNGTAYCLRCWGHVARQ